MPCLYILKSKKNGRYYVGSTNDLNRRLAEHKRGKTKYTREAGPFYLVYKEEFETLRDARKREAYIKRLKSRIYIEELIMGA